MLRFRDFTPRQVAESIVGTAGIVRAADYESFDAAAEAAAEWIAEGNIVVRQLETVVLPNIWRRQEEGPADGSLRASGEAATYWHQFLRVWYEDPSGD